MAKKICSALCVIVMLFTISGCAKDRKAENRLVTDFTAEFSAEYKDMSLGGSITVAGQGIMNIKITSPETISGLEVTYKNSQILIALGTLECSADEAYLPQGSFPQLVNSVMQGIYNGRYVLSGESENEKKYSLKISGGNAVIRADEKNFITEIEVGDCDFKISLKNVKEI